MSANNKRRNLQLSTMMSSRQVCEYLGFTRMTLLRKRKAGVLVPQRTDAQGRHIYSRAAVEEYERKSQRRRKHNKAQDGGLAADVFKMFQEGRTDQEIVMELRIRPVEVERLREQFTSPKALLISPKQRRRLDKALRHHRLRYQSPKQLVTLLVQMLETNAMLNRQLLLAQEDGADG